MTKKQEYKIGDRVAKATSQYYENEYSSAETVPLYYNPDGDGLRLGEVTDISAKGKITVKWDGSYGRTETLEAEDLMTEEAGKARYSELEAEFSVIEKQVAAKVKEIAQGIREANALSKKVGKPLAQMGYEIIYRDLYKAMDDAGWNTSSFGC